MELSLEELKQLVHKEPSVCAFEIGKAYLIRGVTNYVIGRLSQITPTEFVLTEASWIPDTGRFHDALLTGIFEEVEPFDRPAIVCRGSWVDATEWTKDLPRSQK